MSEYRNYPTEYNRARRTAVALSYDMERNNAPIVVATGDGWLAEKIISIAEELNIPVYRDETTATLLSLVEPGREVPVELYQIVAKIYTYICQTADGMKAASTEELIERAEERFTKRNLRTKT